MANRLQKTPRLVYTPAVQAVAPRPGYCITRQVVASSSGISLGGQRESGYQPTEQIPDGWDGISDPNGYGTSYSPFRPVTRTEQVCYPGIPGRPAVPSRIDQFDSLGWNGGARSGRQVPNEGFFRCTLPPSPIGVQFGLSARAFTHAYSSMSHSIVARRDEYTIVERGAAVFGPQTLDPGSTVEVRRSLGVVTYLVNDEAVYESAVPSAGEAYGAALLYSVIDYVDSPEIATLIPAISFSAVLPAMQAAISDASDVSWVRRRLPAMRLTAELEAVQGAIEFSARLPSMVAAISDTDGMAWLKKSLPAIRLLAAGGAVEEIPNSMVAVLPPPIFSSRLQAGNGIAFSAVLPSMQAAIGEEPFNRVMVEIPARLIVSMIEPYMPAGESDGSDAMYVTEEVVLETALIMLAMESVGIASANATLTMVLEMAAVDAVGFADQASIGWIVQMLAHEKVAVFSKSESAKQQALQYAVNYMTGALTTYRDFDFLGFTHDDGQAYAWRKDGLYRLGGESGEVVSALVDFGASDYGEARKKIMSTAFVGVRTDGECYLRLCADEGPERVYKLLGGSPQSRALLAKGVDGRTWNMRLELTDATYASVDNIELEIGVSQRRGFGRRS